MYAKMLEHVLALLCEKSDLSHTMPQEFEERFKVLRAHGRLPQGRERREELLTHGHVAAAVLGLVSPHASWAGLSALVLEKLCPVGGPNASFFETATLGDAIALLISEKPVRSSLIRVRLTVAETGVNSNGGAELIYERDGKRQRAYYVSPMALSLQESGSEVDFDLDRDCFSSPVMREVTFNRHFFDRLALEYERAELFPRPPPGDSSEYDPEEAEQNRRRKLGVRGNSRYIHIGVENQVTWPKQETVIKFDRYELVLLPKTNGNVQSVHVDMVNNGLSNRDAMTVVNRFLSVMAWCDDNFAIAQPAWSGSPIPAPVARRNLAASSTSYYVFDRKIPASEQARRALALFREARNAQHNAFVSYAVLNYYKIIEIRNHGKEQVRKWFKTNFESLRAGSEDADYIRRFLQLCGNEPSEQYIHNSCRIAVAHANKYSRSDPDDAHEILRLHTAAAVMHHLARQFIAKEFEISNIMYSGD